MDKKLLEKTKDKFLTYKIHYSGVDVENLENDIYKTKDDFKKISIELKRLSRYIHAYEENFTKYSYKFYEIYNEFTDKGKTLTMPELDFLKYKIVELEILCGIKVGLVSVFAENKELEALKYIDLDINEKFNVYK